MSNKNKETTHRSLGFTISKVNNGYIVISRDTKGNVVKDIAKDTDDILVLISGALVAF